eukprot:tig00000944_g5947.t2
MALLEELVSKLGASRAISRLRELWMPELALALVNEELNKGVTKALLQEKAELLSETGRTEEAIEAFGNVSAGDADPAAPDVALVVGHAQLLLAKDPEKAAAMLDGAVKAMASMNLRTVPDGFVTASRVWALKQDYDKALDQVESALVKQETASALLAQGDVQVGQYLKELNKRIKAAHGGAPPPPLAASLVAQHSQEKDAAKERLKAAAESFGKAAAVKGNEGPHVVALWRLALASEELALFEDLAPAAARAVKSVKAGEDAAATASAMEDEIRAIAKSAFLPPTATTEELLKCLEEEYSSLIKAGRSDAAAFVQELHAFKAAQAAQAAEAKAAAAGGAQESPAAQALQRAAEALKQAVAANAERPELRTRLARVLLLQGKAGEAREEARAAAGCAAETGRGLEEARFYLGLAAAAGGPLDEPRGELRELLCASLVRPTNPDLPRGALALARHYHGAGRHRDALAVLEELRGFLPEALPLCRPRRAVHGALERAHYEAQLLLVECQLALGSRVAAAHALLDTLPRLFELARSYNARSGVPFPLVDLLEGASRRLVELMPSYAHGHTLLGNAALLLWEHEKEGGRLAEAEAAYRRSMQLEGTPVDALADGLRPGPPPQAAAPSGASSAPKPAAAAAAAKGPAKPAVSTLSTAKPAAPAAAKPAATVTKPAATAAKPVALATKQAATVAKPAAPAAAAAKGAPAAAGAKSGAGPAVKPATSAPGKAAPPVAAKPQPAGARPGAKSPLRSGATVAAKPAAATQKPAAAAAAPAAAAPASPAKPAGAAQSASQAGGAQGAAASAKFLPGGAEKNPRSVEPRHGLAKALREKGGEEAALEGVYREIIGMDAANHEAVFGLGGLLEAAGRVNEAVKVYAAFPSDFEKPSFDDASLHGEIVKMLFKGKLAGDPQMVTSLTLVGRVLGLTSLEKDIERLEALGLYETLKAVYCGVNRRPLDDPDMQRFFASRYWT